MVTWRSRNPDALCQPLVGGGSRWLGARAGSSTAAWSWEYSSRFGYAFNGVWSGKCAPPADQGVAGDLIDVSLSADLLCTSTSAAWPHVGALKPLSGAGDGSWPGPESKTNGVAFGRLL